MKNKVFVDMVNSKLVKSRNAQWLSKQLHMQDANILYYFSLLRCIVMIEKLQQRSRWRVFTTPSLNNEGGFILITSLMMLTILTLIAVSTSNTTRFEQTIATNERLQNLSFYSAEAARSHVEASSSYYDSTYIVPDKGLVFPDETAYPVNPISSAQALGANQSYHGRVVYKNPSTRALRGSGFSVGSTVAQVYNMLCVGTEPRGSETQVEAGFYRIAPKTP